MLVCGYFAAPGNMVTSVYRGKKKSVRKFILLCFFILKYEVSLAEKNADNITNTIKIIIINLY